MKVKIISVPKEYEGGGSIPTYPSSPRHLSQVEVEDGESALVNSNLVKFEGKKHSEGGIPVNLPGGTLIFSEHLKPEKEITEFLLGKKIKKRLSYSDISKKFPTQKSLSTLKNPDSDPFEINTAELTLNKNQAMLDTIFSAQEAEKMQKDKRFQKGGKLYAQSGTLVPPTPLTYFNSSLFEEQLGAFPYPTSADPFNPENYGKGYEDVGKSYPFDSGRGSVAKYPFEQEDKIPQTTPSVQAKRPIGKSRAVKASTAASNPTEDNFLASVPLPLSTLPQRDLSSQLIHSRNPFEENQDVVLPTDSDSESYPGFAKSRGKSKFGINPKLAGTIMDIGLAMSDNLNVEAPVLFNNKTYPLFNRFVNFDNKEPGRNLALSVQQIQNSNVPEQVKQAQIAQLTAQANEQQSQVDFSNQQRYEEKQERDINKLQDYQDRNTLVGNQDLENYLQRKGRVESLKNEFKARRKSNIVNSIRGYADYASEIDMANQLNKQLYGDSYETNILTGRVNRVPGQPDPFLKQERGIAQYAKDNQNAVSLPNGATLTMVNQNTGIVTGADGKIEIIKLQ